MLARSLRSVVVISFASFLLAALPVAAQQEPAPYRLTLSEAIRRGLEANLRVLAAEARMEELGGTSERARALLLPRARIEAAAALQNRNLSAFGIFAPGIRIPRVVGPFSTYDFRGYAEQPLLDLRAYYGWKAAEAQQQAARQDYQDARDQIVRFVAALYLNAQAATARVEAARARVATAEELLRLAQERHGAGVATGVDVTRAEVELADARQRLLESQNAEQSALLLLARNIGLRPGTPLELAESLAYDALALPDATAVLAAALDARADYRALLEQRSALERQRKAAEARRWPRLSIGGNYGGLGRSVGDVRGTGALQATLALSVFDRDREGEQAEIAARLQTLDSRIADLRLGIEQEVRDALLALESAAAEVNVAQQGLRLAERELQLARERFEAGVASNIEVVTAQSALARARENVILAVTRHSDAKMALARAAGATEQNYSRYLNLQAVPATPPQKPVQEPEGQRP